MEQEIRQLKEQVIVLKRQLEDQRSEYYDQLKQFEHQRETQKSALKDIEQQFVKVQEDRVADAGRVARLQKMFDDSQEQCTRLRTENREMEERRRRTREMTTLLIDELKASKLNALKRMEQRFMVEREQFQSRQAKVFEMMRQNVDNCKDVDNVIQKIRTELMGLMSLCQEKSLVYWRTEFSSMFQGIFSGAHMSLHKLLREWKAVCHFGIPSCQICNFEFCSEIPERTARTLECGHTLCQHCAQKMFEGVTIKCPFDRREAVVGTGDASDLPKNFTVMELMDVWKRQQESE